jgi:hypothetical protein
MITRRLVSMTGLGLIATGALEGAVQAQSTGQQPPVGLRNRGAPAGRVGAATRTGIDGQKIDQTLDLVAPQVGIGLSSADQPTLCYLLARPISRPLRFVMSLHNQSRPVADLELHPPPPLARLGVVHLRDQNIRLVANQLYVWSVAILLDPQSPSRDLVASALIQYHPIDAAMAADFRQAVSQRDYARLGTHGYWYDAVALAEEYRSRDRGAGLEQVLQTLDLDGKNEAG